jgi:hypothetical protein
MTIKNHQTIPGIVEKGIQEANSTRIELLGSESLIEEARFRYLSVGNRIHEEHEVGTQIFYIIENNTQNAVVAIEKGIGRLEKEGEKYFINRLRAIVQGKTGNSIGTATGLTDFEDARETYLSVITSSPSNINEMLFLPNSVATTSATGPQTTVMAENSLLGRLTGNIQSLDSTDLSPLLGDVSLNQLRLSPTSRPLKETEGTIYLDSELNVLKIFDGTNYVDLFKREENLDGGNF